MRKSKELAFLHFLTYSKKQNKNLSPFHSNIDIEDLEKNIALDKIKIKEFLTQLKDDNFLNFKEINQKNFSIDFNFTEQKLLDFITPYRVDSILETTQHFIFKYIHLFDFKMTSSLSIEIAKEIQPLIEKDPNFDISQALKTYLIKGKQLPEIKDYFSKLLLTLSDNIEEEDQEILENIIYLFIALAFEDNPFVITLFLCRISIQLEAIKKGVSWDNLLNF